MTVALTWPSFTEEHDITCRALCAASAGTSTIVEVEPGECWSKGWEGDEWRAEECVLKVWLLATWVCGRGVGARTGGVVIWMASLKQISSYTSGWLGLLLSIMFVFVSCCCGPHTIMTNVKLEQRKSCSDVRTEVTFQRIISISDLEPHMNVESVIVAHVNVTIFNLSTCMGGGVMHGIMSPLTRM